MNILTRLNNVKTKVTLASVGLFGSALALAADGIDVSEGTSLISSGKTAVAAIGGGLLALAVVIVVYKKLQRVG